MNLLRLFLTAALLLGPATAATQAKEPPAPADVKMADMWKLPEDKHFEQFVPPPPKAGRPMDQADFDYSLAVQATATVPQIADARRLSGFDVFTFAEDLGPAFSEKNYPKTAIFFDKLKRTANKPKNYLKDLYQRPRPYLAHPGKVKLLVEKEEGYSYPSGHSTRSWLFALVLGELDPDMKSWFLIEAAEVGHSRIVGGMHNESDVITSRALSQAIFTELMKNGEFKKDLAVLKAAEWKTSPFADAADK